MVKVSTRTVKNKKMTTIRQKDQGETVTRRETLRSEIHFVKQGRRVPEPGRTEKI